jgi:hypothetical protein
MSKPAVAARQRSAQSQGQILLGRALFCVGCEIIFTGSPRCPRCSSAETVWPLANWLHSIRGMTVTHPTTFAATAGTSPMSQQHKRPAA